jgi:LuxR family maltose regulon positive regulatory protein
MSNTPLYLLGRKERRMGNSQFHEDKGGSLHFERHRLNNLFREAVRYPLVVVCAGGGYGKTSAVDDFVQEYQATTTWMQLSERDNICARFCESFSHSLTQANPPLSRAVLKLGFPETRDKMNQYMTLLNEHVKVKKRVIVMDDFHCIENPSIIRFIEEGIVLAMPPGTSVFLISRSVPPINIAGLVSKGQIFNISEDDLRFTDDEIAQYFRQMNISPQGDSLREIMQDTEGWAFAINLIAHSYQKAPGYGGYLRSAMKINIFRLMETEIWDGISERLQNFLTRLSLIDHLSIDLIALLAAADKDLIAEMEKQSAYIRRDSYINAYHIHPLFLEYLTQKQESLSEEQKQETYAVAGKWCNKNGFKIDALSYFEKIGDYTSMVAIFLELPAQIPRDIAEYAAAFFDRVPPEAFDTVEYLALMHLRMTVCLGLWDKATKLAEYYEAKFLKLPEDNMFRKWTLSGLYYCWGVLRSLMCIMDDRYDIDIYFEKFVKHNPEPVDPGILMNDCLAPWINLAGTSRKGAPDEFIAALSRAVSYASHCFKGLLTGEDDLARGELKFYQGDIRTAENLITRALSCARKNRQFEVMYRALFYTLRIAVLQGDYIKAEKSLKEMKSHLEEPEYFHRFVNYDIALAWYYFVLDLPEKIPHWVKDDFSPYGHAAFIENFGNQMKARYCYMTRNYPLLLSYIQEMKERESFLFGRVEMLAIEACVHYKMKDKKRAFAALLEAYQTASPNELVMPFIELGKDMRTMTIAALKEKNIDIPQPWLESINRKAASYAKHQVQVARKFRQERGLEDAAVISPRESEVLSDLANGLSRAEIAANRNLSINTVKMVINSIYMKLGAENIADVIRIAMERKMI